MNFLSFLDGPIVPNVIGLLEDVLGPVPLRALNPGIEVRPEVGRRFSHDDSILSYMPQGL